MICEDMTFSRMDARENAEYIKGCIESLYDSKRDSFFISPEWFSTWLETLPASVLLEWVEGSFEGQVKVGFFLGHVPVFFYGLPLGQLGCFNATGNPYYDELTIEYSDYLGNAEYRQTVINYFYSELTTSWKLWKLDLPGTISQLFQPSDEVLTGIDIHIESRPSHFVDLQAVITAEAGYLGLLGKNRRSQIRRSIRLLEEIGEISIDAAQTVSQAHSWFDEMSRLNIEDLERKQRTSCFSNDYFQQFHKALITKALGRSVVIYACSAGDQLIGFIYGFFSEGRFLYYQSGFQQFDDNKLKPGQTCHALLIEKLAKQGIKEYDFLAGTERYKQSLSTNHALMQWVVLRRDGFVQRIVRKLKGYRNQNH